MDEIWSDIIDGALASRDDERLLRSRNTLEVIDAVHVKLDGKTYVNFASNNYLGLTHHPALIEAAKRSLNEGVGAGAAGLITGFTSTHAAGEAAIAQWKQTQAAVILPSGYQANLAAVQALVGGARQQDKRVRFLIDKLAHASLIDAVRGGDVPFRIFPHNHLAKLERLLVERDEDELQVVLTESVFSMDGDFADLAGLARLKGQHPFFLLLDEAHASGIYGENGRGYAAESGFFDIVDASIVTLSKAIGCVGGVVCGSRGFCDLVLNFGRAYIYSTGVPPFVPAVAIAAIDLMCREPQRSQRVRQLAKHVREMLDLPPGDSPIIPIILGNEDAALRAADQLKESGLLTIAVRPPTVPPDGSRLRVTLSCEHSDEEIARLINALKSIKPNAAGLSSGVR